MDIDDIFDTGNKRRRHNDRHFNSHDNRNSTHRDDRYDDDDDFRSDRQHNEIGHILDKLRNNAQLKLIVIIVAVVVVVILIIGTILLIPLLMQLLQFVSQNGIQGLIETIWKGTN